MASYAFPGRRFGAVSKKEQMFFRAGKSGFAALNVVAEQKRISGEIC